jgi:hypothetical protein
MTKAKASQPFGDRIDFANWDQAIEPPEAAFSSMSFFCCGLNGVHLKRILKSSQVDRVIGALLEIKSTPV